MKELLTALSNVKKEVGTLSKTETNPFFKSKYFDINSLVGQIEPLLEKNGLLLLQPIRDGKVVSIIYHVETEKCIISEIELPPLNDPQKLGSAITYYRRYTLQSLLGLQAEDDDANKASQPTKQNVPTQNPIKENATTKILQLAKDGKYTIEQVKAKYLVSKEQETEFKNLK
jgi:hypothetical protein